MSLIFATFLTPINDITTSFSPVPQYVYLTAKPYNEEMRPKQAKLYPDLAPLALSVDAPLAFARVERVARAQPDWKVVSADNLRVEAEATSSLLHFVDDVVIEVRPEVKGSSVHMRSRSRVGRNDFAANYKRIRHFFAELEKAP
jgi:uncharacterized protein (DUF1499 family)